jgi:type I restriction enzyme, S subunit
MKVKLGYKETEVGIIPKEWNLIRLGDVFIFKNGLNKEKRFFGHGTPIVNYMDVFSNSSLYIKNIIGCVEVNSGELDAYNVFKGDVFFTRTSETVEEIGMAAVMLDDPLKTVYSGFILRARPIDKTLDNKFKSYCFTPYYFRKQVKKLASQTTRALTNGRLLSASLLACPPLAEQKAIAAALNDFDELLKLLNQLIKKKQNLKQATLQQLFTFKTRLPGFSEKLKKKTLGELGTTYGGLTGKTKSDFGHGKAKYVTFMNLMTNVIIDCNIFERVQVSTNENQNEVLRGDLLFNGSSETPNEVALCSLMNKKVSDLYLNSFSFGYRIFDKDQVDGLFLTYYIRSYQGREIMKLLAQGSTRYNISKTSFLKTSILLPCKNEQVAISKVLFEIDSELIALKARLNKLKQIKQAMMQELLIGKTRLIKPGEINA